MIFAAATNNAKKLKEIKRILNALGHDAKTLKELGIEIEIEENGTTFAENAVIKYSPREGRILLRVGGGDSTAFEKPCAVTLMGSTLHICNQQSRKIRSLNTQTNSVRDYRVFTEKVYKYINVLGKEFVWLQSGLYVLD